MGARSRILFVDDEEGVLRLLQRMLKPMRDEWEMAFCDSGPAALRAMEAAPFDVVVSDMSLPGMSGAQLLAETSRLHPATIRLILSGHEDRHLVMQCVGVAHQYLFKSADVGMLVAAVKRAVDLRGILRNEALCGLIARLDTLPEKPNLYFEIVRKLRDPEASVGEVSQLIERDPAMTGKILQLVNAVPFGLRVRMGSIAEAIGLLGLETIRSMILAVDLFEQFRSGEGDRPPHSVDALWKHSFRVARTAQAIAAGQGESGAVIDEAFVSGLLHDTGKLVLAANFLAEYGACCREAGEEHRPPLPIEERLFPSEHRGLSARIVGIADGGYRGRGPAP